MNFNTKNTNNDLFAIISEKYMAGLGKTKTSISWDPHMEYDRIVSVCLCALHELRKYLFKSEIGS